MSDNLIRDAVLAKTSLPTVKRALDLAALRQKITAGNMANASTPGYRRRAVDFEGELRKLVEPDRLAGVRTDPHHIPIGASKDEPFRVTAEQEGQTNGINNVDVEKEMVDLARTQIWYQLGTTLARRKFSGLRLAIKGQR